MISDPSDLAPEQLLAGAEECVRIARELEVDQLRLLLAWADLHSGDPQDEPNAVPVSKGGPRLVFPGGDGTPGVCDLALLEIAVARNESVHATRRAIADAYDLRHRLPAVWEGVQAGDCPVWVARKVAAQSRRLDASRVQVVDHAVADALDEGPGRILAVAEAKIIEADPEAHEQRIRTNREKKGVWYLSPRPGDQVDGEAAGVTAVLGRLGHADALLHQRAVDDLAAALAEHAQPPAEGEAPPSMDHWRADAFAMLADPAAVLAFYARIGEGGAEAPALPDPAAPGPVPGRRPDLSAQVFLHLGVDTAGVLGPLARAETALGTLPMLLNQVRELLSHSRAVTITPVIDLNGGRSVNGYEHPADVRLRSELRAVGDVFPHASTRFNHTGRPPDHDHTRAFDRHGPPGQTGDHNDTPLGRLHHRVKTHAGYSVFQLGPDRWVWGTPHGLYRLVSSTGTTTLTAVEYRVLKDLAIEIDLAA